MPALFIPTATIQWQSLCRNALMICWASGVLLVTTRYHSVFQCLDDVQGMLDIGGDPQACGI